MGITLTDPLTPEQKKLLTDREDALRSLSVLSGPLPLVQGDDFALLEMGQRGVLQIQRSECDRLQVVIFAIEAKLEDLERRKER